MRRKGSGKSGKEAPGGSGVPERGEEDQEKNIGAPTLLILEQLFSMDPTDPAGARHEGT